MSVILVLTCVPLMLLVPTLKEGTTAHVTLDTMEMDSSATVIKLFLSFTGSISFNFLQILMSVVMKNRTNVMTMPLAMTTMEVMNVLVIKVSVAMDSNALVWTVVHRFWTPRFHDY